MIGSISRTRWEISRSTRHLSCATFLTGTTTAPVFGIGKSNTYPYGFPYPAFAAVGLDAHGGLTGEQISVGAMNPNTSAPKTYNYTINLEHRLANRLLASAGYTGSHSNNLLIGSGVTTTVQYGQDINRFAGDLIQNDNKLTRLNPSFGAITYGDNRCDCDLQRVHCELDRKVG